MGLRAGLLLLPLLASAAPAAAGAADLYVNPTAGCSDARTAATARSPLTPWCSPAPATRLTLPGDVVHLAPATYGQGLRPLVSGGPAGPITFLADGPVTLTAAAGAVPLMLTNVHDVQISGIAIQASGPQAVWADAATDVSLSGVRVTNTAGVGIQLKRTTRFAIRGSALTGNARAGLLETSFAAATSLTDSSVTGNGQDGQRYNGDGVELNGSGALLDRDTITGNGDGVGYEHGVYAGATASGYTIRSSAIGGNAGADIKASGSGGLVIDDVLGSSMFGVVLSDNAAATTVAYTLIQGTFQHGILVTTGATPARARIWNVTVQQTGRSTASGDASAIFVASAASLELRNVLACYTNPDALGSGLFVNDASRLTGFDSNANWLCAFDYRSRRLAWNGSRTTLPAWRATTGADGASVESDPPAFTADGHVSGSTLGRGAGLPLVLDHDLAGVPLPVGAPPDIGAYQG
jgi:hypothetical protein